MHATLNAMLICVIGLWPGSLDFMMFQINFVLRQSDIRDVCILRIGLVEQHLHVHVHVQTHVPAQHKETYIYIDRHINIYIHELT